MPYCIHCGVANVNGAQFCKACGTVAGPIVVRINDDGRAARCKCGSTQLHAEKRGFSLWSGFIGSRKVYVTCLACGRKYRPGHVGNGDGGFAIVAAIMIGATLLVALVSLLAPPPHSKPAAASVAPHAVSHRHHHANA